MLGVATAKNRYEILEKLELISDLGPTLQDTMSSPPKGGQKTSLSDVRAWSKRYDALCDRAVEVIARGGRYDMIRLRADVDRMLGSSGARRHALPVKVGGMCDTPNVEAK